MADLSMVLHTINPFAQAPDSYPVIRVGLGERVIQFVTSCPNSKGLINVQTFPDLADGGIPRTFAVKQSLPIVRWHRVKR